MKLEKKHTWLPGNGKPLIISGPCSAESEEQVLETTRQLAEEGRVDLFRAGIWKPRTRPNSFEGVGKNGLKWLKKAGEKYNIPTTTEVANSGHVEACLEAGIDYLWIGARTTVNPFSIQEVADALKGVDIPVFIKNPINPDLQLWLGAVERVRNAGIERIGLIHRGFSTQEVTPFRNQPKWELAIEMMRTLPEVPIICDPSHIAGSRDLIGMISQKALDLDMDGLMIESHMTPEQALSDAKQQVTPTKLTSILDELVIRHPSAADPVFKDKLTKLREEIDGLDNTLIETLSARMDIVRQIGEYKRDNAVTILQVQRWDEILKNRLASAGVLGLDPEFVSRILQLIHKESIRTQTTIMNRETA